MFCTITAENGTVWVVFRRDVFFYIYILASFSEYRASRRLNLAPTQVQTSRRLSIFSQVCTALLTRSDQLGNVVCSHYVRCSCCAVVTSRELFRFANFLSNDIRTPQNGSFGRRIGMCVCVCLCPCLCVFNNIYLYAVTRVPLAGPRRFRPVPIDFGVTPSA